MTTQKRSKKTSTPSKPAAQAIAVFADLKQLTSHEVGDLIQMDPSTVVKWTTDGLLKTYRTPGGHRRILVRDLREFMNKSGMFIPAELGGGL